MFLVLPQLQYTNKVESKDVEDLYLSLPNQHKHWWFPLATSSEE